MNHANRSESLWSRSLAKRLSRAVLLISGILLVTGEARAFKGVEHVRFTNDGLEIALSQLKREGHADLELLTFLRNELLDMQAGERASLGEVTSAIDYVRSATRFLERSGEFSCFGTAAGMESVPKLRGNLLNLLRAARGNDAHFANEAIVSFELWHAAALALAREARSCGDTATAKREALRGALIIEGAALHYLQDAMASGHIVTPRRRMHNIPSRLLHDRYNRRGLEFLVDHAIYESELEPLLEDATTPPWLFPADPGPRKLRFATSTRSLLEQLEGLETEETFRFLGDGYLQHACEGVAKECELTLVVQSKLGLPATDEEIAVCKEDESDNRWNKRLDRLEWSVDRCAQRILITLVSARSIADVLETFLHVESKDEERNEQDQTVFEPSRALTDFSWRPMRRSTHVVGSVPGTKKVRQLELSSGGFGFGHWRPETKKGRLFYHGWALGITASGEGAFFEGSQYDARGVYDFELFAGMLAPGRRVGTENIYVDKKLQWALIPGFTYVKGPDLSGRGGSLRFVISVKDLDATLGLETAYRKLNQGGMEGYAFYYGLRSELGLGFLTYFIAVGQDEFFGDLGELERRAVVRSGFTFAIPSTMVFKGRKH